MKNLIGFGLLWFLVLVLDVLVSLAFCFCFALVWFSFGFGLVSLWLCRFCMAAEGPCCSAGCWRTRSADLAEVQTKAEVSHENSFRETLEVPRKTFETKPRKTNTRQTITLNLF